MKHTFVPSLCENDGQLLRSEFLVNGGEVVVGQNGSPARDEQRVEPDEEAAVKGAAGALFGRLLA